MRILKPVKIDEFDFSNYGRVFPLGGADDISFTPKGTMLWPYKMGMTHSGAGTYLSRSMERHVSTEEILFAGDSPLVLALCADDPYAPPKAENLIAVEFDPGTVIILNRGIWHDACRGCDGRDTYYYFMALNNGEASELKWTDIAGGPVNIDIRCAQTEYAPGKCPPASDFTAGSMLLHDLRSDDGIQNDMWECWQTDRPYPDYMGVIGFGRVPDMGVIERTASAAEHEVLLSASGVIKVVLADDGTSAELARGCCAVIPPAAGYRIEGRPGECFYLIVKADN